MKLAIALLILVTSTAGAQPRIFFTDLTSGPSQGGENGGGVYVTVWGKGFGNSRGPGTVVVGGTSAVRYPVWSDNKISFQLGAGSSTGDILVVTSEGRSNGIVFVVRSGKIFYVSPSGSDNADGSFAAPWQTVGRAEQGMQAGDTTYVMDGFVAAGEVEFSSTVSITTGGAEGLPKALIAYPGATATIGSPSVEFGLRVPNIEEAEDADHWVLSQMNLRGGVEAASIAGPGPSDWRIVGNNISCPEGNGATGCFSVSLGSRIWFLGNEVHHTGRQGASKQYHSVYFTTDTNHVEVAWNYFHDNRACRAIQFHSSPICVPECGPADQTGRNQYDLRVHDNLIVDEVCDGINFATVDPSKGPVEAFNNVMIRPGAGPHPDQDIGNYSCVFVPGYTNTGTDGSGSVEIYNNTCYEFSAADPLLYAAGAFIRGDYSPGLEMNLRNNITVGTRGAPYLNGNLTRIRGTNNLWFGNGIAPSTLTNNLSADPRFVDPAKLDLHLQAGSSAIDSGIGTPALTDFDGISRPQGLAHDLGAFEWRQQPSTTRTPEIARYGNAFSGGSGGVAPGEIVSLYGRNLGPANGVAGGFGPATGRLPETMAGVSVTVDGMPAPLYFVREDQINLQIPYEVNGRSHVSFQVTYQGMNSSAYVIALSSAFPGLHRSAFHADFSPVTADKPAAREEVLVFFATGEGVTVPSSQTGAPAALPLPVPAAEVSLRVGGIEARVIFRGSAPGTAGVLQINAQVPEGLAAGAHPVVLRTGPAESNAGLTLHVR